MIEVMGTGEGLVFTTVVAGSAARYREGTFGWVRFGGCFLMVPF